jgi:hypothetical protein
VPDLVFKLHSQLFLISLPRLVSDRWGAHGSQASIP